ncbi:hypothetical protein G9A89_017023 [Geosiphon pyriformis]|nr:hypothetical protein G9A89_017023 [Geosiphon pyriformis]
MSRKGAIPTVSAGPALGQRGVKSIDFCKQFNDRTKNMIPDTPIPTVITVKPDRTFNFETRPPVVSWFLKRAAGVQKGSATPGTLVVGKVTLKHVYEIGKFKKMQQNMVHLELESIVKSIIASAKSIGIEVIR